MLKIAVIDDGISTNKFTKLEFNMEIDNNCRVIEYCDKVQDNSHGTICAMIIKKYAPDASLGSIKILQTNTKRGYVNQLKKAIEWCIQNDISLINISLGSTQSYDYLILNECVENAYYHYGIIIVAALSNKHVASYPASFKSVIGVETHELLRGDMYYMKKNCIEGVNAIASSMHSIKNHISEVCNSYAAPLITAKVYQIMNEFGYRDIDKIKVILNDKSYKKLENYNPLDNPEIQIDKSVSDKIKPIKIPCIIIKEENIQDKLLSTLDKKFNLNGYSTLLILTDKIDTVDVSYHIIVKNLNDNLLKYISSKYEADIIIIGFNSSNNMKPKITCDILFYQEFAFDKFHNSLNQLRLDSDISYEIKIGYKSESNLVDYIYQKTIEHLV